VAVAVIVPFAGQWVIEIPARQRRVGMYATSHG
jgi:hypothetical protein